MTIAAVPNENASQADQKLVNLAASGMQVLFVSAASWVAAGKLFGFDELQTMQISKLGSLSQYWTASTAGFDFTPPLNYLLASKIGGLAGYGEVGFRAGQLAATVCASLLVFLFVRGSCGSLAGLTGSALLWASGAFPYSIEARGYAYLLLAESMLMVGCQRRFGMGDHRKRWLWAMAAGIGLATGIHVTGGLAALACLPAAAYAMYVKRKLDLEFILAGSCGLLPLIQYRWIAAPSSTVVFSHPFFAVDPERLFWAYRAISGVIPFCAAGCAVFVVASAFDGPSANGLGERPINRSPLIADWMLVGGSLLTPTAYAIAAGLTNKPFHSRYGILAAWGMAVGLSLLLGRLLRGKELPMLACGLMVSLVFLFWAKGMKAECLTEKDEYLRIEDSLRLSDKTLTAVVPSGTTFLRLEHYQGLGISRRIVYLVDEQRCLRLTGTSVMHVAFSKGQHFLAPHGNVQGYTDFLSMHKRFHVLRCGLDIWAWVPRALRESGYRLWPTSEGDGGCLDEAVRD